MWAKGNLFLVGYSYFAFYMTLFCALLLTGAPEYMMADKSVRQIIFALALTQVVFFNANIVAMIYNYFQGTYMTGTQALFNLVHIYIIIE